MYRYIITTGYYGSFFLDEKIYIMNMDSCDTSDIALFNFNPTFIKSGKQLVIKLVISDFKKGRKKNQRNRNLF